MSSWWAAFFGAVLLLQNGCNMTPAVGPNLNLTKAAGNQYETAVAIDPNDNNRIFVISRNEKGGLYTARSSDGGATWITRLIAQSTVPAAGDIARAYGNASVAWDSFGNLFLALGIQLFRRVDREGWNPHQGVPLPVVAERLGHANQNITLSLYSHA